VSLPVLTSEEYGLIATNAAAVPPAPTLALATAGVNADTVNITWASYVMHGGAPVPGVYTESALSPPTTMPTNAYRTVISPPAPTPPAQAFGYNVYASSTRSAAQLQNPSPIPLGTNFTIQNDPYYGQGRGLPTTGLLHLTEIATQGGIIPGPDFYGGSAGGTNVAINGTPVGNGIGPTVAYLQAFAPAPANALVVTAVIRWTGSWLVAIQRLCGTGATPCQDVTMVTSVPSLSIQAGSTVLDSAFAAGDNAVNVPAADIPILVAQFWVAQQHSVAPCFCPSDNTVDRLGVSNFHLEISYYATNANQVFPAAPPPQPPPAFLPYMIIPEGASQSINELEGQSSIGTMEVDAIDVRGELKRVMADPHALGTAVMFEVGFEQECLGDFVTLHTMQLTDIGWTPEGLIKFSAADVQRALFDQLWLYGGPYQFWQSSLPYDEGDQIIDFNGNIQEVALAGTSGFYQPTWESSSEALTYDGSIFNHWQANVNYLAGATIRDSAGNVQTSQGGISGAGEPIWLEGLGANTRDGVKGSYFYWTNSGPQLTWRNRGQLQPGGPCFADNADYISSNNPRWIQGNPIDIALVAYQNEIGLGQTSATWQLYDPLTGAGLINPNAAVDVPALLALKQSQFSGDRFEFKLTSAATAKDWVENEILKPLGIYHIVRPNGQLGFKTMKSPQSKTALAALTRDNIIGIPEIARWPVLNYVTARFDAQDPNIKAASNSSQYNAQYTFIDTTSAEQFGQYFKQQIEALGLRLAWGGYTRAWLIAQRIFARHGSAPPEYTMTCFLSTLQIEIGDLITLTHPLVPDLANPAGALGITNILCEITDKQPHYSSATVEYKAVDTRFLSYTQPFLIARIGVVPVWTSASPAQKSTYFFVSNSSGKMSDGTAGATIF
jgi:hypothetical protein